MKRVAAFLSIVTIFCSSLVWGSPERQAELLSKIANLPVDSFWERCGFEEIAPLIPKYTTEEDLCYDEENTFLKTFIQNELGFIPKRLFSLHREYGFPFKTHVTDEMGNTYLISFIETDKAKRILENLPKFDALNLKYFKSPPVVAIAEYKYPERPTYYIVAQSIGSATSLIVDIFYYPGDYEYSPKKESLLDSYYHFGLALGELHQKTSNEHSFDPDYDEGLPFGEMDLSDCLVYVPFLKGHAKELKETFDSYRNTLQEKPQTYCGSLSNPYVDGLDVFVDSKSKTVYVDIAEELSCHGYNRTYRTTKALAFIDYFDMLEGFCPPESPADRAPFIEAFNRGYQEAGGTIPTLQQEEIYRFFDALKPFKEYVPTPNFNWLWEKLQSEK